MFEVLAKKSYEDMKLQFMSTRTWKTQKIRLFFLIKLEFELFCHRVNRSLDSIFLNISGIILKWKPGRHLHFTFQNLA